MTGAAQMLTIRVPLTVRKRGGRKLVLTPGGMAARGASAADTTLVKALARALRHAQRVGGRREDQLVVSLAPAAPDAAGAGNRRGDL